MCNESIQFDCTFRLRAMLPCLRKTKQNPNCNIKRFSIRIDRFPCCPSFAFRSRFSRRTALTIEKRSGNHFLRQERRRAPPSIKVSRATEQTQSAYCTDAPVTLRPPNNERPERRTKPGSGIHVSSGAHSHRHRPKSECKHVCKSQNVIVVNCQPNTSAKGAFVDAHFRLSCVL